ncbi:S41 family peptidase [Shewanella sp. AS16]|uniref:S41 family peptidase n=1 Tax=Shewanella sp. AS16 TaxID=2907625 RepID=UPI001F3EC193|nr:S41 family peptidase [Shewanella sp. AS16]MCE9686949.1 S41 family peptidase [Shewanella sp. AS16]
MPYGYRTIVGVFCLLLGCCLLRLSLFSLPARPPAQRIEGQALRQDLYVLLERLAEHSAFFALEPQRRQAALKQAAHRLAERYPISITGDRLAAELTKLLSPLGDPGVSVAPFPSGAARLPVTLRPYKDRWLALTRAQRPLDPDYPFISHIDGIPLSRWLQASQAYLPTQMQQHAGMQAFWLERLGLLRQDIGLRQRPEVTLTLSNDDQQQRQLTLALAQPRQTLAPEPGLTEPEVTETGLTEPEVTETGLTEPGLTAQNSAPPELQQWVSEPKLQSPTRPSQLETDMGAGPELARQAMRISITDLDELAMDPILQATLAAGLQRPLLLLDLRHAHGTHPELLQLLTGYDDVPKAMRPLGFANYRRAPGLRNDYLGPLHFIRLEEPSRQSRLTAATDSAATTQPRPRLMPMSGQQAFSPFYVRPYPSVSSPSAAFPTNNRLALLIGPDCRQECEWIAHSAKSWSRVTLIGERTVGDLGRKYYFTLPNSGLRIGVSASLAYTNEGQLLSGVGTLPDIELTEGEALEWRRLQELLSPQPDDLRHRLALLQTEAQASGAEPQSLQTAQH